MAWRPVLAFVAILPAAASFYFFVFWTWFETWRRHRALTLLMFGGAFVVFGALIVTLRNEVFASRLAVPTWLRAVGWVVLVVASAFGTVADRQIGIRVRSFTPFFDPHGRLDLVTTGAYGVVRHPIYASASWFQLGAFLVTGYPAVLVAWAVFTLGALWFTRREEERLTALLDRPGEYAQYRARVGALFPRVFSPAARAD
jgi:protein-S-isoprenylcysteine O-methyltransferase Ste14